MSRKSSGRKSVSPWQKCDVCDIIVTHKDQPAHIDCCPPADKNFSHSYIRNCTLYSTLEQFEHVEGSRKLPFGEEEKLVLLSQSALQLCGIAVGDRVRVHSRDRAAVKVAWPTTEKSLASVSVSKEGAEMFQGLFGAWVTVSKLVQPPIPAEEVHVTTLSPAKPPLDSATLLTRRYCGSDICIGNRLRLWHYGRMLLFEVTGFKTHCRKETDVDTISDMIEYLEVNVGSCETKVEGIPNCVNFYSISRNTDWVIDQMVPRPEGHGVSLSDIGGVEDIVREASEVLDSALSDVEPVAGVRPVRGVLVVGPAGVGKSWLVRALAADSGVCVVRIDGGSPIPECWPSGPLVAILDDVDRLSRSDVTRLCRALDALVPRQLLFATATDPSLVDVALRRPGRLEREMELPVPDTARRLSILRRLLPTAAESDELKRVAAVAHGFVAADLAALASAATLAAARNGRALPDHTDWKGALAHVRPSAMREVLVRVPSVRWSDIGGQHELKLQLRQAIEWPLRHPEAFSRLGVSPPRGVLMFGPPGCSKTMVAKALATESGLNFISVKGPELFSKWVGESERAVRQVFRRARLVAPAIVFFDELDALGGTRGDGSGSGGVQDRVLAQLLTEMDGVTPLGNVTVVGATNRPDRIDKALLRPGRLDRVVYVPLPDAETRRDILRLQLGTRTPVSTDVCLEELVSATEGYSGAEVIAVCHEAALKALEANLEAAEVQPVHLAAALAAVTPRTPPTLLQLYRSYLQGPRGTAI